MVYPEQMAFMRIPSAAWVFAAWIDHSLVSCILYHGLGSVRIW